MTDPLRIPPSLQLLYDYSFEDAPDSATLIFKLSPSFDPDTLKISLESNNTILSITAPTGPPIVSGLLYAPVQPSYDASSSADQLRLKFFKTTRGNWPLFITGSSGSDKSIDPRSALSLYFLCAVEGSSGSDAEAGQRALAYSASVGFVPAMRIFADCLLTTEGRREEGLTVLTLAGEFYRDPLSLYKLGLLYLYSDDQKGRGLAYLKQAAFLGHGEAHLRAGIVLSPLSNFKDFQGKSATEAMNHFRAAINAGAESAALFHEMAKLLNEGLGCKKDERAARAYQARAKLLCQEIPELKSQQDKGEGHPWVLAGVSVLALSIFAVAMLRHLRR